ncbi:hypothetical protein ANCCAN_22724 [Ancylostoma caninum]|uniref:Uncharacterized protein n=1 Tax=Ancylostoma caninum TaxID=29170 RepID=A0A368FH78_ANCCA|nr:hypothetical protein ANCCAN_22724 [Ancylostoma caninum]
MHQSICLIVVSFERNSLHFSGATLVLVKRTTMGPTQQHHCLFLFSFPPQHPYCVCILEEKPVFSSESSIDV